MTTADVRVAFSYDAQGRRVSKEVDLGNDGSVESETVYSYSGWNCIEEQIIENGVQATRAYAWGNDLSGTVQGAGGVGGLLAVTDGTGMYSAASDANGNITAYFDDNGDIAAEYDYTPFGSVLNSFGEMAEISRIVSPPSRMMRRLSCIITGIGITLLSLGGGSVGIRLGSGEG
jgi:hypothetical protein